MAPSAPWIRYRLSGQRPPTLDREPLKGTWDQAARQEVTSYKDPPMDRHTPVKEITLPLTSFPGGKYEINIKHFNLSVAGTNFMHSVFDKLSIH